MKLQDFHGEVWINAHEDIVCAIDKANKEIINGVNNNISREDIIEEIKKSTRHYAKRQLTYFNHQLDVKWVDSEEEAVRLVKGE